MDETPLNPNRILSSHLTLTEFGALHGLQEDVGGTIRVHPQNILTSLTVHLEGVRDGPGRDWYFAWLSGPTGRRLVGQGGGGGGMAGLQPASYGFGALCDLTVEGKYELRVVQAGPEATVAEFHFEVIHDRSAKLNPPYYGPAG